MYLYDIIYCIEIITLLFTCDFPENRKKIGKRNQLSSPA